MSDFESQSMRQLGTRPVQFDWTVLGLLCVCVVPAMATLDFGAPLIGARYLAGSLLICLLYQAIKRDRYRYMALLIGAGPALSLLRGVFFYNSFFFFTSLGVVLWAVISWKDVKFLWDDHIWRSMAFLCVLYWAISVALKGTFVANIRAIEFILTAGAICLLSTRRSYLATALLGIAASSTAYAIAMLPYGVRLGEGELDNGQTIGNPALMGIPSALIVLLALTDRGRYLLLENKIVARAIVCLVIAQWLILSGSRGSWLITLTCLAIVFTLSPPSRKGIVALIALGCIATLAVLTTDRGEKITNVFDKTMDSNRSLANRTSGRSSMWEALPEIFAESPVWGWGPGSGADVDYLFTHRHLIFHSLYEQIIVECGMLGFLPMMATIFFTLFRAIRHYRRYGEVTPLIGIVGFMIIGVSVTAFDFVSGTYLGLALMSRESNTRFVTRRMRVIPVEHEEHAEAIAV
jgi:O-antigen ligase